MNLRDALQRTVRDGEESAADRTVGETNRSSSVGQSQRSASSPSDAHSTDEDLEARDIASVLEAIELVADESAAVVDAHRPQADYGDPFFGNWDDEVNLRSSNLLPPEANEHCGHLESETPPQFSYRLRQLDRTDDLESQHDGPETRNTADRIVSDQRAGKGNDDLLGENTEPAPSDDLPAVSELTLLEMTSANAAGQELDEGVFVRRKTEHSIAEQTNEDAEIVETDEDSRPLDASFDVSSLSSEQWAGASISAELPDTEEAPVAGGRLLPSRNRLAEDDAENDRVREEATTEPVESSQMAEKPPVVASAAPPIGEVGPSRVESSIVAALRTPRLAGQYRALWERMQPESGSGMPCMLGMFSVDFEPHCAQTLGQLAVLLSRHEGLHVLVVDADLTRRSLSSNFRLEDSAGLSDVCMQRAAWDEVIVPTSYSKMCILPAGRISPNAADLSLDVVPALVECWKSVFDVILVDVGDVQADFAQAIFPACDANYLLVRLGKTDREIVDNVVAALTDENIELSGCIVTNVP